MKQFVKLILNEARVQRTIDPKIWASMSSMTSRLRATLGEDAKPMKKDTAQVLLLKYVAGLLTMKIACPKNVSEIEDLKAYKLIGQAYIDAGGTISEIQKLYVENGGVINPDDMVNTVSNDTIDEPEIEDEYVSDEPVETDIEDEVIDDMPFTQGVPEPDKKFDFNAATKERVSGVKPITNRETKPKAEIASTQKYINTYLKRNREILTAKAGQKLVYNEELGTFAIASNTAENMPTCAGRGFENVDKKTRFFIVNDTEYPIGNAGNNGVYDDFYFKRKMVDDRLEIIPGSNYYQDEETKGKFYTQILSDNGMNAAMHVEDSINLIDINDENACNVLKASAYLPTLPELAKIIDMLPSGVYWTSSVANDGTSNIALSVMPDKILANASKAKVVTFIKFDI